VLVSPEEFYLFQAEACVKRFVAGLLLLGGLLAADGANATYTMTFAESGSDVVATGSGTLNLTALQIGGSSSQRAEVLPPFGYAIVGPLSSLADPYDGVIVGPTSLGPGPNSTYATLGADDVVGLYMLAGRIFVPAGYINGAQLTSTSTFANETIASLGLTPGIYTYTWGFGGTADTFIIIVSPPTVNSISPTSGSTAGGDTITITGTNLTGATGITVGGAACAAFNVSSATSATCVTPAGSAGTASVVVTTAAGSNAANTLFTYTPVPAPSAVPSLSEWTQLLLALMTITLVGWHFHRARSY
jgi:hypothetical protein